MVASSIHNCTDFPVFLLLLFAVAMTTTDSVWCMMYMVLVPKDKGEGEEIGEHAYF